MELHGPRPRLITAGAGSSLLALLIPTTVGVGVLSTDATKPLPEPIGCMSTPAPDAFAPPPPGGVDFTVTVVPITAAHPQDGPNTIGVGFAVSTGGPAVQGMELFLVRGTTYVFSISGGHPFAFNPGNVGGPANAGASYPATNGITGTPTGGGIVTFTPNATYPNLIYYVCNSHEYMGWKINISDPSVLLAAKVFLGGPYGTGPQMSDALRAAGLVPTTQPYSAAPLNYSYTGGGPTTTTPAVLGVTGNNAIADWVVMELRNSEDPATVVVSRAALLQRDGDVVDVDGISPVAISAAASDYYVVVRHRNHLGVMTAGSIALSGVSTPLDFTSALTLTAGGADARRNVGGTMVLWGGDVNFNGNVQYVNAGNDRDFILTAIGGVVPTTTLSGQYRQEDINMDASVIYVNLNNDRDIILSTIGGVVPTTIRLDAVP